MASGGGDGIEGIAVDDNRRAESHNRKAQNIPLIENNLGKHRHRMHRSSVRPFFCCGSELSLNSITEVKELQPTDKDENDFIDVSDSDELVDDLNSITLNTKSPHSALYRPSSKSLTEKGGHRPPRARRKKNDSVQDKSSVRKRFWTLKLRGKSLVPKRLRFPDHGAETSPKKGGCVCTGYKKTEVIKEEQDGDQEVASSSTDLPVPDPHNARHSFPGATVEFQQHHEQIFATLHFPGDRLPNFEDLYPTDDIDEKLIAERRKEMEEGIEVFDVKLPTDVDTQGATSGACSLALPHPAAGRAIPPSDDSPTLPPFLATIFIGDPFRSCNDYPHMAGAGVPRISLSRAHTQVDYIHCLVPDLEYVTNCGFYWAVMDRYEADRRLENKPEGTFLLRDSAQDEFLFSVSFRRYGRSLHARIEQWNHKFSFDSHDPGVFACETVGGLIEHYKDPSRCMFFEPMLTRPLNRSFTFSLQHMARAVICSHTTYDGVNVLPLPRSVKEYLRYYHYKQKVRVRWLENSP